MILLWGPIAAAAAAATTTIPLAVLARPLETLSDDELKVIVWRMVANKLEICVGECVAPRRRAVRDAAADADVRGAANLLMNTDSKEEQYAAWRFLADVSCNDDVGLVMGNNFRSIMSILVWHLGSKSVRARCRPFVSVDCVCA